MFSNELTSEQILSETLSRADELARNMSTDCYEDAFELASSDSYCPDAYELEAHHVELEDLSVNGGIW